MIINAEELMNDISDLYYNDTNEKERKILDRINKITNKKR